MKIASKSILSPGRAGVREPLNPLSNSLSRRLKNSGSIKGGASPAMFPTAAAKKRGSFENLEPSSPKVTCIGQVRVKGRKKQAKKLKSLSRRHSSNEVNGFSLKNQTHIESLNLRSKSSQNYVQSQNQECTTATVQRSWVHFPVTICDALRAFGSEFSCLFPCRKEEKMVIVEDGNRQGSCGVFARWLVAVQDEDNGGGRRDIELVVGKEDEVEEDESIFFRKTRRHVFEDLEIVNDKIEGHKDEARVSICIPPKNALLLMRCRSDPVKIQALSNRSWEPNVSTNDDELAENEDQIQDLEMEKQKILILDQNQENVQPVEVVQDQENDNVQKYEVGQDQEHEIMQNDEMGQDQEVEIMLKDKMGQDQELEILQKYEVDQTQEHEFMQKYEVGHDQEIEFMQKDELEFEIFQKDEVGHDQNQEKTEEEEKESLYLVTLFEEIVNQEMLTEFEKISETHEENLVKESKNVNNGVLKKGSENVLPECLLMMMYEPKLSMEVSKETWVCSKDFIRRNSSKRKPPPLPALASVNGGDQSKATATVTTNGTTFAYDVMRVAEPMLQQAARSSCSFPAASMATMLEEKLANAVGYEPFVLTRCKSEPMKTGVAAKLIPESCVWENRKLEILSRGTFGVGAAGLGF